MAKSSVIVALAAMLMSGNVSVLGLEASDLDTIDPAIDRSALEDGLGSTMSPTDARYEQWDAGWIPEDCKATAEDNGLSAGDMEVFDVYFSDCDQAWVMCRHKDADKSLDDMIDHFGRMPLQMREFATSLVVIPDYLNEGIAALTWSNGRVTFEATGLDMYNMVHELSHLLDWHARSDLTDGPFSDTGDWQDNYSQDSAVVSGYAQTNWLENFAETGVIGVYDKLVDGGFGAIQSNWNDVFHQYATYQGYMEDFIIPGTKDKCTNRQENPEPIQISSSSRILGKKPDTRIKPHINVIPSGANNTQLCSGRR